MTKKAVILASTLLIASAAQAGNNNNLINQTQAQSGSISDNRDLVRITETNNSTVNGETKYRANSAIAAPLVTGGNEVCMGSTSVAGQGLTIGASFATTWTDDDCVRRKDAMMLHNLGDVMAAKALMCQKEDIAAAYKAAGIPCPGAEQTIAVKTEERRVQREENTYHMDWN